MQKKPQVHYNITGDRNRDLSSPYILLNNQFFGFNHFISKQNLICLIHTPIHSKLLIFLFGTIQSKLPTLFGKKNTSLFKKMTLIGSLYPSLYTQTSLVGPLYYFISILLKSLRKI